MPCQERTPEKFCTLSAQSPSLLTVTTRTATVYGGMAATAPLPWAIPLRPGGALCSPRLLAGRYYDVVTLRALGGDMASSAGLGVRRDRRKEKAGAQYWFRAIPSSPGSIIPGSVVVEGQAAAWRSYRNCEIWIPDTVKSCSIRVLTLRAKIQRVFTSKF